MIGLLVHLVGIALLVLVTRRWPRLRVGTPFFFLGVGVLLIRPGSSLLGSVVYPRAAPVASGSGVILIGLVAWVGAALVLRALYGLAMWDRPAGRRLRVSLWLAAAALLLMGLLPRLSGLWVLLTLPLVLSFRWRARVGALGLVGITLGGLVSLIACTVTFGTNPTIWSALAPGLFYLPSFTSILMLLYSLAVMPAAASRVHLSIRTISRRLVGSHALAGAIPVLLTAVFLLLSSALYLSTYRGTIGVRTLLDEASQARRTLERGLEATGEVSLQPFGPITPGQIVLVQEEGSTPRVLAGTPAFPPDRLLARRDSVTAIPLLWDGGALFLRARVVTGSEGRTRTIEALAPVDSLRLERIRVILGTPVRISPQIGVRARGVGITIGSSAESEPAVPAKTRPATTGTTTSATGADDDSVAIAAFHAHSIGAASGKRFGLPGGAIIQCLFWRNGEWSVADIPISSSASIGEEILALFSIVRENPLAGAVLAVLSFIAILFLGAIGVTIAVILGMGRSITLAVRALTQGAQALGQGRLEHRIAVEGDDELWSVATSFNQMAADLQKMRTVELESQRLEEELRLARVIQDRLLPSAPPVVEHVELAGVSLPAREIGGDYFDYFVLDSGHVAIAVADVSGKGAPAALLMSTFRASLRSQDLAALGPGESLARINRFIHSSIDPGRFITAFLGLLDPATGEFRYANAGHDCPVLVKSDGSIASLSGGGLILGMLPQIVYEEASARIDPGSLVAIFTDGITEARDVEGGFFGEERLIETLKDTRGQTCAKVQQRVMEAIRTFAASAAQSDDITLVLMRRS